MNFVFDVGNVLIDFRPMQLLTELFSDSSVRDRIYMTVFCGEEWVLLDKGQMTHSQAQEIFCKREADLTYEILLVMSHLRDLLTPINNTIALLPKVLERGHRLFYLSNYHLELRDYILDQYQFFKMFEGGVFSCDIHVTKPDPYIYRYFLKQYMLNPKDSILFDDMIENVNAAIEIGMKGVIFDTAESLKPYL